MIQKKSISIILFILLFPCKVQLLFPFNELAGLVLDVIWGRSAPLPEILKNYPMINMTTEEIIRYYGYRFERHEVVTDDGYILELHRIVNNNGTATDSKQREPIIFIPGLLADSSSYISMNKTHSPGFFFTDAGYDVWLHNNRGTRYSRRHKILNPNTQQKFWDYSFHEMGVYDLPAAVDHILETTNASQVYLTGYSMGCTSTSIFLSEKQSYREKVKKIFLWAPAVYEPKALFSMGALGRLQLVNILLSIFDEMELLPYNNNAMLLITRYFTSPLISTLTDIFLELTTAFSLPENLDDNQKQGHVVFIILRCLAGSSVKTIRHYIQMVIHSDFSQYDYGTKGNMIAYNQTTPPPYILQNIKQPTYIYYSEWDALVNSDDVREVSKNFTNLKGLILMPEIKFSHFDFAISPSAKKYIYEPMLREMSLPDEVSYKETVITTTSSPISITTTTGNEIITTTSTPINDFDNSDYFYNLFPMILLIVVIILLFVKFFRQQLSETKVKYKQMNETSEI